VARLVGTGRGSGLKTGAVFAGPAEYLCSRGYVAVVQDCRGRFGSEGEYYHMANEAEDGYAAAEWIARRPWSDGKVGTFGVSYGAQVQSAMATQAPPHLAAMIPVEGPSNIYSYGLRHDGAFQLKFLLAGFWLAADSQEAAANPAIAAAVETASQWLRGLPLKRGESPLSLAPGYERFVLDFMTKGDYEEFWANPSFNTEAHYERHSDVPIYLVGGWYDSWSRAMTTHFVELSRRKSGPIKLLMGPWAHGERSMSLTYSGDVDFGPQASLDGNLAEDSDAWRLRWFDRWLKGLDSGVEGEPPIKVFVMGGGSGRKNADGRLDHGGRWRDEREWPLARARPTDYYLHSDGTLSTAWPRDGGPPSTYRFDPEHPVQTISGNLSGLLEVVPMPEGLSPAAPPSMRRRQLAIAGGAHQAERPGAFGCEPPYGPLAERPDVLVFQTPRLLTPGRAYEITIILAPTSNLFKADHRIRLDISSSNFPRFDVNPNTGEPVGRHSRTAVADNAVYHDARHPSHVVLPIVGQGPSVGC